MNVEENRLRTFGEWPANAAVDATRIAKAGFYYTGRGQEVQCFICGTRISDWNYGDQAMVRHRLAEPACPFVVDPVATCNVPYLPVTANDVAARTTATSPSSSSLSDPQPDNDAEDNPGVTPSPSAAVQNTELVQEYGTVAQRLQSFTGWPIASVVSPVELAEAGFYYRKLADMVECAFCRGVLMNWKLGDNPDRVHRAHFPNCDFYMRREIEDAVSGLDNVTILPGTGTEASNLGIQMHMAPSRPEYATYEARLQTYKKWPAHIKQTPEMLSDAGFYYVGYNDQVRCFHCDGGLRGWEPTDDVWVEHARWFSKCGYVILVRGQSFIQHCIDNRPPLDSAILNSVPDEENADIAGTSAMPNSTGVQPNEPVPDRTIKQLLNTLPALTALEVGLSIGRVTRALIRRMQDVGTPYKNAEHLIEDVLHDQLMEEDIRLDNNASNSSSPELINLLDETATVQMADPTNNPASQSNEATSNSVRSDVNLDDNRAYESNTQESNALVDKDKPEEKKQDNKSDITVLREENRKLKEARLCKICMDRDLAVVFLPCGHLATCIFCAPSLTYCPMCRVKIKANVRIFLS
ncbi:hypothetical protein DMN91_006967 [Ooceraea biroi]|uniref:RING-type domain-containing protein n=1 Tax=Ooceraea biroi TaxID=2015173 RepID=A0A3L8DKD2_OOCBI|nr:putative inhibitor of apoptosis [Ooceraea biroi]XP_011341978.2 putative inhibitor of apoptosis [Ooceraea biroi]RLU20359.1 hypothetical protein DMN91_006967 [Ooceraea biroi]